MNLIHIKCNTFLCFWKSCFFAKCMEFNAEMSQVSPDILNCTTATFKIMSVLTFSWHYSFLVPDNKICVGTERYYWVIFEWNSECFECQTEMWYWTFLQSNNFLFIHLYRGAKFCVYFHSWTCNAAKNKGSKREKTSGK